jgi:hypothetical protein
VPWRPSLLSKLSESDQSITMQDMQDRDEIELSDSLDQELNSARVFMSDSLDKEEMN